MMSQFSRFFFMRTKGIGPMMTRAAVFPAAMLPFDESWAKQNSGTQLAREKYEMCCHLTIGGVGDE